MSIKWGIIGPGKIAHVFAEAVTNEGHSSIYAVASRDAQRAADFASRHHVPVVHKSYDALIDDDKVDIVYIATPHSFHERQAIQCIERKKPVLCEKPLTVNFASAIRMVDAARANKVFLMEAMWTRFIPATLKVIELIEAGLIGEVKYVRGDFGDKFPFDRHSRVYDMKLGAGSILDIGIYPLFLSLLLLGKPDSVKAFAHLAETGADDLASALLYYKKGCIGSFMSTTIMHTPVTAEIIGTDGMIVMDPMWYKTKAISLIRKDEVTQQIEVPYEGNGFEFQIREVLACLQAGKTESTLLTLDFTLQLSQVMDEICSQTGLGYSIQ